MTSTFALLFTFTLLHAGLAAGPRSHGRNPTLRLRIGGQQQTANQLSKSPKFFCGPDTLLIYQDCRICSCPNAYKLAKCYKKDCEPRKKPTGTCPSAILRLDDMDLCDVGQKVFPSRGPPLIRCNTDLDCPGPQLCCLDFCKGYRCVDPAVHKSKQSVVPRG